MSVTLQELQLYNDFESLAKDVLDLAQEILPDQLIYLTSFNESEQQVILKLSGVETAVQLNEGMVINLNETVCNRIDFERKEPLVYEDVEEESVPADLKKIMTGANIRSYMGIPISLSDGKRFGTLCAAHDKPSEFDSRSIALLQRIVRLFSYYLVLERFAYRDSLTELYNRHYLSKYFSNQTNTDGALFFLDLDGFKNVNDIYGHDAGDAVLQEVASRLDDFTRHFGEAFAVRLGGDEFVALFPGLTDPEEMEKRAGQMLDLLNKWEEGYTLSASIGIGPYTSDGISLDALLKSADEALYRAKSAGKNKFEFTGPVVM